MKSNVEYVRAWRDRHPEKWKAQNRATHLRHKAAWFEWLQSIGYDRCFKCGYDKCFEAIDFHHMNPAEKEIGIGDLMRRVMTPERQKEVYKCVPLCANCHREEHRSWR